MGRLLLALLIFSVFSPKTLFAHEAAFFSFTSVEEPLSVGEQLEVEVMVEPNGEAIDTVRTVLTFPPNLLQAVTFRNSDAFERISPANGFNQETGIWSAGAFTVKEPVTKPVIFGTFIFQITEIGHGQVELTTGSHLIANGAEHLSLDAGKATISFSIDNETSSPQAVEQPIDNEPPNQFTVKLTPEQLQEGEEVEILFGTTDEGSGIASYELFVDGQSLGLKTSPQRLSGLPPGTHLVEVKATDQTGNYIFAASSLRVYPEEISLPKAATSSGTVFSNEKSVFDMWVTIPIIIAFIVLGSILILVLISTRRR